MKKMSTILSGLLLSLASFQAFAQDNMPGGPGGPGASIPEPGALALLAVGAAAAAIAWSRGKNKKK
jgi:hypothetical protein